MQKKQAISYVRFSSARQKFGTSVERQEAMIAAWLTNNPDYESSELKYKDLGKSGSKGEHIKEGGGFAKLLLAVKQGAIKSGDVILVEAIDRTGRLPLMDMLTFIIAPILRAGVSIITLDDNVTYTEASANSTHVFLLVAKIQAAHDYSKSLGNRITDSYTLRRNAAKKDRVTPKRMTPVWLNSDGSVREDVKPWIKTAFELYVSGMGKATIAKRMRESGVERLAKCSGPSVEGWLRNKAVIGKWETLPDKPELHQIIDDVYPPIIEPSLFYKAQIHAEKVKTKRPVKTAKHFLVGLVRCGSCGKNYIIQNKDGAPHSMRCRTRQQLKSCENSHIVPKPVMDTIYRYTSVKAADEAIAQQQLGVNEKEIISREAELLALSKSVEGLALTIAKVGRMPELDAALERIKGERESAENALIILRATPTTPSNAFVKYWQDKGKVWDLERDDPQQLAAMLRTVDYAITINADGRITSSHSDVIYRYAGVDRKEDKYKLKAGRKLILVPKVDYPENEPDQPDEPAESVWTDEDYEDLRSQHE